MDMGEQMREPEPTVFCILAMYFHDFPAIEDKKECYQSHVNAIFTEKSSVS